MDMAAAPSSSAAAAAEEYNHFAQPLAEQLTDVLGVEVFMWQHAVALIVALVAIYASRCLYFVPMKGFLAPPGSFFSWSSFYLDEQMTHRDNKAVAVTFSSVVLSVGIVLVGSLYDRFNDDRRAPLRSFGLSVFWIVLGFVLLSISWLINAFVVLFRCRPMRAVADDGNLCAAFAVSGSIVASALVVRGAISGDDTSFGQDVATTLLYYGLGQICFAIYAAAFQLLTRIHIRTQIAENNAAAGVSFCLNMIAVGWLVSTPIWRTNSLVVFALWFVMGGVLLFVLRLVVNYVVLRGENINKEILEDKNWGVAVVEGGISLMFVACLDAFLPDACI